MNELNMKEMPAISGGELTESRTRLLRNLIYMGKAVGVSTVDQFFSKYGSGLYPEEFGYIRSVWDSINL